MRQSAVLALVALCLTPSVNGAQSDTPNFSGRWVLDTGRGGGDKGLFSDREITITQSTTRISVRRPHGGLPSISFDLILGGAQNPISLPPYRQGRSMGEASLVATAIWENTTLVVDMSRDIVNGRTGEKGVERKRESLSLPGPNRLIIQRRYWDVYNDKTPAPGVTTRDSYRRAAAPLRDSK